MSNPSPHVLVAGVVYAVEARHVPAREAKPARRDDDGKWFPAVEGREAYDVWDVSILTTAFAGGFLTAHVRFDQVPEAPVKGAEVQWVCRPYSARNRSRSGSWFNSVEFYFEASVLDAAPALSSVS